MFKITFLFDDGHKEEYAGEKEDCRKRQREIRMKYSMCCKERNTDFEVWKCESMIDIFSA